MECKAGDRVRINAGWVFDVKNSEGIVSNVDRSGFQLEGHRYWFGWHELAAVLERKQALPEEPLG